MRKTGRLVVAVLVEGAPTLLWRAARCLRVRALFGPDDGSFCESSEGGLGAGKDEKVGKLDVVGDTGVKEALERGGYWFVEDDGGYSNDNLEDPDAKWGVVGEVTEGHVGAIGDVGEVP